LNSALVAGFVGAAAAFAVVALRPGDSQAVARSLPPLADVAGANPVAPSPESETVRPAVGLLPSLDPRVTEALVQGATLAFEESRAAGGPALDLVVGAASPNQWASVASETVRLAVEERVVALIAPPERSLAHPVAQAATRCRVPVVSTSRAPSVAAAGSRYVVAVVPEDAATVDDRLSAPSFDAGSAFATVFAARFGRSPDAWAAAGYDAARVVVEGVRRGGLAREAISVPAVSGTPVTGSGGPMRFDRLGRRESAGK